MSKDKSEKFLHYWRLIGNDSEPVAEYNFDGHLKRKHRFDWAFVEQKVAVEVDGGTYAPGGGRHAKDKDREKLNIAASEGWKVFRFSPQMLDREPHTCIEQVKKALDHV